MSDKSMKVGLEIVDETKEFKSLKKGIDDLEQAGVEVDDLTKATKQLAQAQSEISKQQGLINHFKALKIETKATNDAFATATKETTKHAKALTSLEDELENNQQAYDKTADKLDRFSNRLQQAKDRVKQLQQAQKDDKRRDYTASIAKAKNEVERFTKAKKKLTTQTRETKAALRETEKAVNSEKKALEKALKSSSQLKTKQNQLSQSLQETRSELKQNGISTKKLAEAQTRLNNKTKYLQNSTNHLAKKMRAAREEIEKTAKASSDVAAKTGKSATSMGSLALKAGAVGAAIAGVVLVAKEIVTTFTDVDREFDRIEKSFTEITGSTESANVEMGRMIDVANRLGLSFTEVSQGYAGFLASAKGANFTFSQSSELFEKTAQKVLALGGNTENVNGVLLAFSQILSKGKVATEELNQIAERLPGTFQFAADAMGVTSSELRRMLEQGKIMSNEFLPKFVEQLKATGQIQETNAQTAAKLKNEWQLLVKALDDSIGVSDGVQKTMGGLAQGIKLMRHEAEGNINLIPDGMAEKVAESIPVFNLLYKGVKKAGEAIGEFVEEQNKIGDANARVKQTTDELVQALVKLNEARKGGDTAAVAKAEREYATALERTGEAYGSQLIDEGSRSGNVLKLKEEIKKLTPEYEKLAQAVRDEKAAGLESTTAYQEKAKKADELKNKIDALKQATKDLSQVKVGVLAKEDAEKTQQAIDGIIKKLKAQSRIAIDARTSLDAMNAAAEQLRQTGETESEYYQYVKSQIAALAPLVQKYETSVKSLRDRLAELSPAHETVAQAVEKTKATLDESVTKTREYEQAIKATGKSFSEYATGVSESEQKIINGTGAVIEKFNKMAGSSEQAGKAIGGYLTDALSKVKTPEGMKALVAELEKIPNKTKEITKAIAELTDKIGTEASRALEKLGLSTKQVQTGIRESAQETIDQFSVAAKSFGGDIKSMELIFNSAMQKMKSAEEITALKEQMQATGRAAGISSKEIERLAKIATDAANQATPEWQRLSKAISDATDAEQLRKFGEEARQAMNAGKISAEQYADVLKQVENQQKQLNQAKERQASAERRAASAMQASTQAMAQNTQKTRENTEATKENANAKTSLESLKKDWSTQSEKLFDDFGLTEDQRNELKQRALDIADWGNAATENTSFNELKIKARAYRRQNQREKAKEKAQASQQNINDEIAKALADLPPPTIQIDGKALAQTVSNHIAQREQHLVKAVGERVTTDLTNEINSALKAGGGYSY